MQVFNFLNMLDSSAQVVLICCIFILLVLAGCSRKVAKNLIAFLRDLQDLHKEHQMDHTSQYHQLIMSSQLETDDKASKEQKLPDPSPKVFLPYSAQSLEDVAQTLEKDGQASQQKLSGRMQ